MTIGSIQPASAEPPESVTGVQLMQGIGVAPAKGFWADAWAQVTRRKIALAALAWLALIATVGVLAPLLANGHPIVARQTIVDDAGNAKVQVIYPMLRHLKASDLSLLLLVPPGLAFVFLPLRALRPIGRANRLRLAVAGGILAGFIVVLSSFIEGYLGAAPSDWARWLARKEYTIPFGARGLSIPIGGIVIGPAVAFVLTLLGILLPGRPGIGRRTLVLCAAALLAALSVAFTWNRPLVVFNYLPREVAGSLSATYTAVPFSPSQRFPELDRLKPLTTLGGGLKLPPHTPGASRTFLMGTDALGQDVLANLMHACRLAISIGLVSTGIAVLIGVTIGSLMGYFGGWLDLVLFRVVEVFMAVPVLFLLIVAAAVLPAELRTTYTMMAIIGCFTWTGAARFTRAEFLKLRNQDFVQSARAVGLPLRSILFKQMLPNGVTPVLVDASFAVAAAIAIEATLSFLGLGPVDQASWGKLLASAVAADGVFKWWLAAFPGGAIFLTVLSYNLIGEALRDAIDPRLKKARV